jgi:hypothetical protein
MCIHPGKGISLSDTFDGQNHHHHMKSFFPAFAAISVLASCSSPKTEDKTASDSTAVATTDTATAAVTAAAPPVVTVLDFKTRSGKTFSVIEEKTSASISKVSVAAKDFTASNDTFQVGEVDPVANILQADLNKDGFEEVYIITRSTGSGSAGNIYGYASNKDKSISSVHAQEIGDKDLAKGGKFAGYQGHDSIYVKGNMLARQFPVYKDGDKNAAPTGGMRTVYYALKPGEAAWQLAVSSVANSEK